MRTRKVILHIKKVDILVFVILLLTSQSTIFFGTNNNNLYIRIGELITIVCFAYLLVKAGGKVRSIDWIKTTVLIIPIVFSMILNNDFQFNHVWAILAIIGALLFSYYATLTQFAKSLSKCVSILSIISLLIMVLSLSIPAVLRFVPKTINLSNYSYYNFILGVVPVDYSTDIYRNYGIFREPGVFQFYICLAALFEICYQQSINKKRIIIFAITLLTTFSTTGYISAILILALMLFEDHKIKKVYKYLLILFVIIITTYLVFCTNIMDSSATDSYSVFGKLHGIKEIFSKGHILNSSLVMRVGSILVNANLFINNWMFGLALNNLYDLYIPTSNALLGVPLRYPIDGYLLQFAKYGIVFGAILTYGYLKLSKRLASRLSKQLTNRKIVTVIVLLFFILQLMTENYSNDVILYLLMWYGLKSIYERLADDKSINN